MNREYIKITGANEHNLKKINIEIPRNELVVITGLSGSGKSSLAFDTIYAEGQRRYMESLSSYARQFLGQMEKPDVELIEGLSPAISIDQKSTNRNPRSTVGTVTEIYDHFRLLFARIGIPHCPNCGREIRKQSVDQMVDRIMGLPEGTRIQLLAPVVRGKKGTHAKILESAVKSGYVRARIDGNVYELSEEINLDKNIKHTVQIVVDRLVIKPGIEQRMTDSIENVLKLTDGLLEVQIVGTKNGNQNTAQQITTGSSNMAQQNTFGRETLLNTVSYATGGGSNMAQQITTGSNGTNYGLSAERNSKDDSHGALSADMDSDIIRLSGHFACPDCGISVEEIEPRSFSFNNPYGACPECYGIGYKMEFDEDLIIPDKSLSIDEGCIAITGWQSVNKAGSYTRQMMEGLAAKYGFSLATPFKDYPKKIHDVIIFGTNGEEVEFSYQSQRGIGKYHTPFEGLIRNIEIRYRETASLTAKAEYEQFMRITPCKACGGRRLKPTSLAVTVGGLNIAEVTEFSILRLAEFLSNLRLTEQQQLIGHQVLKEINARVGFLKDVGLGYLTLARATAGLSGGEAQRIRLATQIGSGLVGVVYILDEPSIGLHQRDNGKLLKTLRHLKDLGNTLIVVEHDEETMREADYIVDIGPGAGEHGGEVVAAGTADEIMACPASITGDYLAGRRSIPIPDTRRTPTGYLTIRGARENNLRNIDVDIPVGVFTCVTGVSGSGKSSLINEILYKSLAMKLNHAHTVPGAHDGIDGLEQVDKVIAIDQSPIGRTPRSNPATYTGVFDLIRDLFASSPDAKARGYSKGRFSFNVKGGRCEACSGDGIIKIEMHFLPDVYVPCEVCKGKRYNRETLEVKYKGKNIYDVLNMTVEEALEFFSPIPKIRRIMETLNDVGLGYIRIGQPSTQLSGGEAQRIKLAAELSRRSTGRTVYILDEPTTGLHFEDVNKLVAILQRLAEGGNTVVVIEHNLDVIKTADYIIDMGPEGGDGGGTVIAGGTPEEVAESEVSFTGEYLRKLL